MEEYLNQNAPLFTTSPLSPLSEHAQPPKSALPLQEKPLREKAVGPRAPRPYRIMQNIRSISSRAHRNAAIDNENTLWTWGATYNGKGIEVTQNIEYAPQKMMEHVISVSVGQWHYMCITQDHKLWGWGRNERYQLGLGDTKERSTPTFIMENVKAVFCGDEESYIIKTDDSLWCCGYFSIYGLPAAQVKTPTFVMHDVQAVCSNSDGFLAVSCNGQLWGWGLNRTGIFFAEKRATVDPPAYIMSGVSIAKKSSLMGALITPHSDLYVFGAAACYPYGLVPYAKRQKFGYAPIKIMDNVSDISLSREHSLVLLTDGRVLSFGENTSGQCGTGKYSGYVTKPRLVMENAVAISTGLWHSLCLQNNGDLWIWGGDYSLPKGLVKAGGEK